MKGIKFVLAGILFGIVMSKSEAISWYRIQEMFRFHSFHMYGILGSAVLIGSIFIAAIKAFHIKNIYGEPIVLPPKEMSVARYLIGGIIFGFGWALTGACPGPIFVNIGHGLLGYIVVLISALGGTFVYGLVRKYLPH